MGIFSSKSLAAFLVSLSLLAGAAPAHAALYAPGETLDPACAPGDADCGVASVVGTGVTGQVPYYAANGGVVSPATSLIWDATNARLAIGGTLSDKAIVEIRNTTGWDDGEAVLVLRTVNETPANMSEVRLERSRGTYDNPLPVLAGDYFGEVNFVGYDGSVYRNQARLTGGAEEDWSLTSHPTFVAIRTTPSGSINTAERFRISAAGNVGIGTTSPYARLSLSTESIGSAPALVIGSSTATSLFVSGSGQILGGTSVSRTGSSGALMELFASSTASVNMTPLQVIKDVATAFTASNASSNGLVLNNINVTDGNYMSIAFNGYRAGDLNTNIQYARIATVYDSHTDVNGSLLFMTRNSDTIAERMRITSAGNVGIGSSTPYAKLSVSGAFGTTPNGIVIANTSGSSGWDTITPFAALDFDSGDTTGVGAGGRGRIGPVMESATGLSSRLGFFTAPTTAGTYVERVSVSASGNLGIGTTSPWKKLSVAGTVGFDGLTAAVGTGSLCLTAAKEVVYNASDNCLSSTRETKHAIDSLALSELEMLQELRPVSFVYNGDATERLRYGFIADEADDVDEHLATRNAEGKLTGLDTSAFLALIVGAVQELSEKVSGFADSFTTKRLCVGETCVTESEFKALLEKANTPPAAPYVPPASEMPDEVETPEPKIEEPEAPAVPIVEAEVPAEPAPVNTETPVPAL